MVRCCAQVGQTHAPHWVSKPSITSVRPSYNSSLPPTFSLPALSLLNSLRSFCQTFLSFHSFLVLAFPCSMELRGLCVLPSNAPALSKSDSAVTNRVLQEQSGNKQHSFDGGRTSRKRSSSSSAEKLCSQSLGGRYFTGNLATRLSGEKSEEQINYEFKKVWDLVQRCETYQKYRDRQPTSDKDREQKWPDNLEKAFFRGILDYSTYCFYDC
jgi:hypothetical protein